MGLQELPPGAPDESSKADARANLIERARRIALAASAVPARQSDLPGMSPQETSETNGLLDIWQSLRRRKAIIAVCCFLGGVLGLLSTLPQTPVYEAAATLEIQPINQDFLQMRNVNPTSDAGADYYQDYNLETQVSILESRTLLDQVATKLKDRLYPGMFQSRLAQLKETLGIVQPTSVSSRALKATAASVRVRAKPNTRLLEITCDSISPQMASDFVNALTAEYIQQNMEARWQTTQRTGEFLTRQMEDVRLKLERSEDALQNYARETGLMFTSEKDNIAEQKLRQMQEELGRATDDRIAKQSKYDLASKTTPDSVGEVLDDATLRDYQSKLTDLRRQRAVALQQFTEEYPAVKKLDMQIATLQTAFEKSRNDIIHRINTDYQVSLQREKLLSASYETQAQLVNQQAAKVTHYNILKHEVDTGSQLYDNMLQRVKEAGIASALRASNVRVVDEAEVPRAPYKPSAPFSTGIGLFGGLFVGIWAAVMRSRVDRSLQDPSHANLHLGIPLIGLIPSAQVSKLGLPFLHKAHHSGKANGKLTSPERLELICWQQDDSLLAEAFRSATMSLLLTPDGAQPSRIVVVTSPQSQEGKTTVTSNLGITLAQCNQRVLLVDADMRRPSLSKIFGLSEAAGLANLLHGEDGKNLSAVDSLIQPTEIPGLSILSAGPALHKSTQLLYTPKLDALLSQLRSKFDVILIDTPPMLQIPDARIIGKLADDVVLVVRAGHTTRELAQSALQRFAEDGTSTAGAILNGWDPKDSGRYSYYRDYHKYYKHYNSKQFVNS